MKILVNFIKYILLLIIMASMEELLNFGRSIRDLAIEPQQQIFQNAVTYPSFFDTHLLHEQRKIKILHDDPNANIKAFYFQYLIICFQLENQNFQFYIGRLHHFILDPQFSFLFLEDDDQQIFNDKQFKRFFLQFLDILDSAQFPTVEAAINKYPVADVVFTYFFRSLLIYAQITDNFDSYLDRNTVLGFLMQNFKIDAVTFQQKGLKFCQAEVFLYQENPRQIYMVYKQICQSQQSQTTKSQIRNSIQSQQIRGQEEEVQQNISTLEQYQNQDSSHYMQDLQQDYQKLDIGFKKQKKQIIQQYSKPSNQPQYSKYKVQPINFLQNTFNKPKNNYQSNSYDFYEKKQSVKNEFNHKQYKNEYYNENTTAQNFLNRTIQKKLFPQNNHLTDYKSVLKTDYSQTVTPQSSARQQSFQPSYVSKNNSSTSTLNKIDNKPVQINEKQQDIFYRGNNTNNINKNKIADIASSMFNVTQAKTIKNKLDVSHQFTDSLTLIKMGQPFVSHIKAMKTRSREFRQSLMNTLK